MNEAERAGWRWYTDARALVQGLAQVHSRRDETVAGVIAALSQRQEWRRNVRAAQQVLSTGKCNTGLRSARTKAERIVQGEHPWKVLRGPKVRAFYRALLGDDRAVVIDTWMCRALGHRDNPTVPQYRRLAARVRSQADRLGRPPAVHQAIMWVAVRGKS